MKRYLKFIVFGILFGGLVFPAAKDLFAQNDGKPKPRDIIPIFETSRPSGAAGTAANNTAANNTAATGKIPTASSSAVKPPRPPAPIYSRISQKINSGRIGKIDRPGASRPLANSSPKPPADIQIAGAQQIGITLWKLLPNKYKDLNISTDSEYLPQINNGRTNVLTPARMPLDTLFQPGDYVRLAIEAGRRGYLYVVDQEMYADGTMGEALLVFPNKRLRSGANLIAPGSPVELPDLTNNPFYFELRPESQNGKPMLAEILSVIVTDRPIAGLQIGDQPLRISETILEEWRKKYAGRAEIFEAPSAQQGYSKAERTAGSGKGKLTTADPLPQTVFLVEANRSGGSLITVPLWYGKNE